MDGSAKPLGVRAGGNQRDHLVWPSDCTDLRGLHKLGAESQIVSGPGK